MKQDTVLEMKRPESFIDDPLTAIVVSILLSLIGFINKKLTFS
jgi:hypothetical protein